MVDTEQNTVGIHFFPNLCKHYKVVVDFYRSKQLSVYICLPSRPLPLSITTQLSELFPPNSISTLSEVTARQEEDICTASIESNQVWVSVPVMVAGIQKWP